MEESPARKFLGHLKEKVAYWWGMESVKHSYPKRVAEHAVSHYPNSEQVLIAVEEMGELTTALMHLRRQKATLKSVQEEIADVCLAMESLKHIYGYDVIEDIVMAKAVRLSQRMKGE